MKKLIVSLVGGAMLLTALSAGFAQASAAAKPKPAVKKAT